MLKRKSITPSHDLSVLRGVVIVFNTESVWHFFKNEHYSAAIEKADYICIDGAVLAMVARCFGIALTRFHGPDFLAKLEGDGHFTSSCVIGGDPMNQQLVDRGVISTWINLPFTDDQKTLTTVVRANAREISSKRYVMISLGLPKQELLAHWLYSSGVCSSNALVVPVGAALDFKTGRKKRSGLVWQRLGLEWLPRLMREPRMWKRNFRGVQGLATLVWDELTAER